MPADQFIRELLVKKIGMKAIVVGEDYSFGKNREGSIDLLKSYGPDYGFEVILASWIKMSKGFTDRISSTKIRELVIDGHMTEAEKMLGRHYQIRGRVVTGRDRGGKLLGIPTANINLHDELCPKTGIYAVTVECRGNQHNGVANIGYSPTFEDHEFTVEVHILDFNDNIYGEKIRVNFIKRLRDEIKFSNISALIDQIKKDIAAAREFFSK
jgi:riboflavin kinase/FMN adenylyltransferase